MSLLEIFSGDPSFKKKKIGSSIYVEQLSLRFCHFIAKTRFTSIMSSSSYLCTYAKWLQSFHYFQWRILEQFLDFSTTAYIRRSEKCSVGKSCLLMSCYFKALWQLEEISVNFNEVFPPDKTKKCTITKEGSLQLKEKKFSKKPAIATALRGQLTTLQSIMTSSEFSHSTKTQRTNKIGRTKIRTIANSAVLLHKFEHFAKAMMCPGSALGRHTKCTILSSFQHRNTARRSKYQRKIATMEKSSFLCRMWVFPKSYAFIVAVLF